MNKLGYAYFVSYFVNQKDEYILGSSVITSKERIPILTEVADYIKKILSIEEQLSIISLCYLGRKEFKQEEGK